MARVPSDPAQVIVNHASFRVQLGATSARALTLDDTAKIPVVPRHTAAAGSAGGRRKLAPVVWSGHSTPGDPAAGELLQAVRRAGISVGAGAGGRGGGLVGAEPAAGATQLLPRIDDTLTPRPPRVVGQRAAQSPTGLLSGVRPARGAYDDDGPDEPENRWTGGAGREDGGGEPEFENRPRNRRGEPVRQAWYPGHRMNLGIVLLPLRIFLGFVCIYAGMGKLCDPVYFDGGKRGSMVKWLTSLHPWGLAEPLRDAALNHPVGAGLSIAFLQVVVGVLTICGLWQRIAACFGAALSIALLVTVSWRTVPVYDAPDFIYLAAWSPLIIAGAPVYSIDGHLASDAWRRLGPRAALWDLRRRVLRRGVVLATVIAGLTLIVGSVLGAAVRATSTRHDDRPGPTVAPTNNLPGSPLPEVAGNGGTQGASPSPSESAQARKKHHKKAVQTPTTTSGSTSTGGTGSSGSHGGSSTAPGGNGGTSHAPAPPPPTAQAPAPPAPSSPKPTQGAIGGLLGSHSPTGLLLGMGSQGGQGGDDGTDGMPPGSA